MTVRFEKTPAGEVAILPREEYEALVALVSEAEEDEGTARIIDRALAADEPTFPKETVDRLVNGENPVRVFREWRGMTQVELASRTGVGQGHISDIESGRRTGKVAVLRQIADALRVPLDLLA